MLSGRWSPPKAPVFAEAHMIDRPQRPHIHFRWVDSAEKRRWMARLKQEFEFERLTWPLDE